MDRSSSLCSDKAISRGALWACIEILSRRRAFETLIDDLFELFECLAVEIKLMLAAASVGKGFRLAIAVSAFRCMVMDSNRRRRAPIATAQA